MPLIFMALRFKVALVLRAMRGFPICCRSLLQLKNAGACSSSWGHPLGVRRRLGSGFSPCGVVAALVSGALGPDAVPSVWVLTALGFPLVLLVSLGRDGGSAPPGGVPGISVATPFPSRRARARVLWYRRSSPVAAAAKATLELLQGGSR
jgi:hypothetical protein